ncbi:hypothetical protein BT96DRAFT_994532 [Gymnopus androsaceus JB14]|uniref:Uncharacterized protein n=1 Tax=Gymnopus androsaceus JB14 TaxID=1447944 RepID=A0A6A4HN56_9AGAR|nr:hypothetical protein BT96DRAFT_994532 [Gymnopus androsaceus JB14]
MTPLQNFPEDDAIFRDNQGREWVRGSNNSWVPRYALTGDLPRLPSLATDFSPLPPQIQTNQNTMSTRLPPISNIGMTLPPSTPQQGFMQSAWQPLGTAALHGSIGITSASSGASGSGSHSVNPASIALPDDDDDDFPPPHKILPKIARPASKVGSVCQSKSSKGKAKAIVIDNDDEEEIGVGCKWKRSVQKGRSSGAANYSKEDYGILFPILEKHLPLAQHAWSQCTELFNKKAEHLGHPTRLAKSLENKLNRFV